MSRAVYWRDGIDAEDQLCVCVCCGAELHADCISDECPACGAEAGEAFPSPDSALSKPSQPIEEK